jgi:endonuclease/exonuclease/phosphatase family metal-dependent hydrolase
MKSGELFNPKATPGRIRLVGIVLLSLLLLSLVFVLNASRVGPLETCLESCSRHYPQAEHELQVMNLNMLHGYPEFDRLPQRIDLLADQINLIGPDVVTLQEVPWTRMTGSTARYIAQQTGMNYVYLPANGNRWTIFFAEGEAILSRYPLKDLAYVELQPRAGFFEHRVALKAIATTPFGEIQIISTHLTNGAPEINLAQTKALFDYATAFDDGVLIIGGDFNAQENSSQTRLLTSTWIDTYRRSNHQGQGLTCCAEPLYGTNIDSQLEKRIDYIFLVSNEEMAVEIVESQLVMDHPIGSGEERTWVSDHIGILTTFKISTTR